jgi:prevent-host-death family protein
MLEISIAEASAHLAQLVDAALTGQEIVLTKDEEPLVKLTPMSPIKRRPKFGSAKGLVTISDDFDE